MNEHQQHLLESIKMAKPNENIEVKAGEIKELFTALIADIRQKRKEVWVFYHDSQQWKEQKEAVKPYDELIEQLTQRWLER